MIKTANLTGSVSRNAGGLYESVRRLAQSLMEQDVDVRVMGSSDEFTRADIGAWHPAQIQAFKPFWPEGFGYSPEFLRELLAYRPDLTHTHGIWRYTSIATNNYCRITRTPYIISPHGMLDPWAVRNSRWKKAIAHALYEGAHLQNATCLRALCESEAQSFRLFGLKNPIVVIPNGIDFPEDGGLTAGLRHPSLSKLQTPNSDLSSPQHKTLLYLGRIHPKKGLSNLLRAWASVTRPSSGFCPQSSEWTLAIAGWDQGGHEAELKKLATELGIDWEDVRDPKPSPPRSGKVPSPRGGEDVRRTDEVRHASEVQTSPALRTSNSELRTSSSPLGRPPSVVFLGPQFNEAKAECYRNCDAFILPSFSEGLPMVVLEAWAYGKPVLMTPECNLPEGFANHAAVRIDPNTDSIVQGLASFFSMSDADHIAMGEKGFLLVESRFSWKFVARQLKETYEWMLGGGSTPSCLYSR